MLGAVVFGHQQQQAVIDADPRARREGGKPLWDWKAPARERQALVDKVTAVAETDLRDAYAAAPEAGAPAAAEGNRRRGRDRPASPPDATPAHDERRHELPVRARSEDRAQPDPVRRAAHRRARHAHRAPDLDPHGVLPRTHGSALFTRGETQALVVATLGTARDEQIIDALQGEYRERFMLHYNMPPYATGETGRVGTPKRREIGHGRLAKRALLAVLPTAEEFAYSMRVVSEITESNGSSSMASVCGGCLALMDAGVPTQGARRRHRDGPDQGRQPLRGAHRHPGRRGSPRRHGLQGRGHRPRHHRAADGHQDPGHHQGDHGGRARRRRTKAACTSCS